MTQHLVEVTIQLTLTRELTSDAQTEMAAERVAAFLKGVTVIPTVKGSSRLDRTRVGIANAEVIDWDGERIINGQVVEATT